MEAQGLIKAKGICSNIMSEVKKVIAGKRMLLNCCW